MIHIYLHTFLDTLYLLCSYTQVEIFCIYLFELFSTI